MKNEIRIELARPTDAETLQKMIDAEIEISVDLIHEEIFNFFGIQNRIKDLEVLKALKNDPDFMELTPNLFRQVLLDSYNIDIPPQFSTEDMDYLIEIRERSITRDTEEATRIFEKSKSEAFDNIVIIADYQSFKTHAGETSPFELMKEVVDLFPHLKQNCKFSIKFMPQNLDINDKVPEILNKDELLEFVELINYVRKNKLTKTTDIGIREYSNDTDTSIEQVIRANSFVKTVANDIKSKNLTPFETIVMVHKFCAEFHYTNRGGDERYGSRLLKNSITGGNFNCVGFSTLFKSILDEIGDPNIESSFIHGIPTHKDAGYNTEHGSVMVKIKDAEYEIDGIYVCDVSLNNSREPYGGSIACCMMTTEDLDQIENFEYFYSNSCARNRFYNEDLISVKYTLTKEQIAELEEQHQKFIDEHKSHPVAIYKFDKALTQIALKSGLSQEDAENFAEDVMDTSLSAAINLFSDESFNSFYLMAEEIGMEPIITFDIDSDESKREQRKLAGKKNRTRIENIISPSL